MSERWALALVCGMVAAIALVIGTLVGYRLGNAKQPCRSAIEANYRAWQARGVEGFAETWPKVEKECLSRLMR